MHLTLLALFLSAAATATAQSFASGGPARFPCYTVVAPGTVVADPSQCTVAAMTANQACPPSAANLGNVNGGFKNYGNVPSANAQCYEDGASGLYFCGYFGAACTVDADCDNGSCQGNVCTGSLGYPCTLDSQCLGNLYCSLGFCGASSTIVNNVDQADGSLCDDGCVAGNFLCASGICDGNTGTCAPSTFLAASQRSRSRRTLAEKGARSLCPSHHTACPIPGSSGQSECVDTQSNLEQCGACTTDGGVDCTALPGVDAVGCVQGKCEIWACESGYAWDAKSASCTPFLIAV
ncbi:hypothetical protein T439DRAFT_322378 [Meredithblackwellia eburnea MCA 4105]